MKKPYILLLASLLSVGACVPKPPETGVPPQSAEDARSSDTLIIFYSPGADTEKLKAEIRKYPAEIIYAYRNINGMAVKLPKGASLEQASAVFRKHPDVLSVEPDRIIQLGNP